MLEFGAGCSNVALVGNDNARLGRRSGLVPTQALPRENLRTQDEHTNARFQLLQQNFQIPETIATVDAGGVQHEHENARALYVPEEQVTEPPVLVRALYDARQISDGERLRVVEP